MFTFLRGLVSEKIEFKSIFFRKKLNFLKLTLLNKKHYLHRKICLSIDSIPEGILSSGPCTFDIECQNNY